MAEAYEHGEAEGVSVCYCSLLELIDLSLPSGIKLRIVGESAELAREAQSALKQDDETFQMTPIRRIAEL